MDKYYEEIDFMPGDDIKTCVLELLKYKEKGKLVYGVFNGYKLYSDTVTLDTAYKMITGKTKKEFDDYKKKQIEEYERQKVEHEASIPDKTRFWIEEGKKILDEDKWEYWSKIVPIRLSDLYRGAELKDCLDIVRILKTGTLEDAKKEMGNQKHSGTSFNLVKVMVREFSVRGEEFFNYVK